MSPLAGHSPNNWLGWDTKVVVPQSKIYPPRESEQNPEQLAPFRTYIKLYNIKS
jgi:hypothetical protein